MTEGRSESEPKSIHIVETDEQALERAIRKWIRFQKNMWAHITDRLEKPSGDYNTWANLLRVVINEISRTVLTVVAGTLTALTAIEAFFKFSERRSEMQQQQRELQAKRDELRYQWMVDVELETDMEKRLKSALNLLEEGPKAYNDVLNKYAFKSKESGEAPQAT